LSEREGKGGREGMQQQQQKKKKLLFWVRV
jgi:hypothetical protein